jgi:hypothetical protein
MPGDFVDSTAPSLERCVPRHPEDLPHGLITPPLEVREQLAREKAKHPPASFNLDFEERTLNEWTLAYYFDNLGHEVLYRATSEGPIVLAVGDDEITAFCKPLSLEEQLTLKTWLPY